MLIFRFLKGKGATSTLQGKVAFITGGRSGIGLATARAFHAQGARVVLTGRDRHKLEAVATQLGSDVVAVPTDVTKLSDIDALMARTLSAELIGRGIRVNTITTGPTETPVLERAGYPPEVALEFLKTFASRVPLKRLGRLEEVAKVVLFLASSDSSFVVGAEIAVDGGESPPISDHHSYKTGNVLCRACSSHDRSTQNVLRHSSPS